VRVEQDPYSAMAHLIGLRDGADGEEPDIVILLSAYHDAYVRGYLEGRRRAATGVEAS